MSLFPLLPPWKGPLPETRGGLAASLLLPVPLDPFAPINVEEVLRYLAALEKTLSDLFPGRYEILLAPFGERQPAFGALLDRLTLATAGHKVFRWIKGRHPGPGSALREAVFRSRGRNILVGNLECHYDPAFFRDALRRLKPGTMGVLANRRLPDSEFTVPVSLLSLVYRRHLLGVLAGRLWSFLFSLPLTDNLSGAYVLRREFALRVFNRLTCPGFLYEAELALVAKTNGSPLVDLPARFFLEREKPRLRVYGEMVGVLIWTLRFFLQSRRGDYAFLRDNENYFTADDWGMSPAVNDAILEMARQGSLRRVSVLAGARYVSYRLRELKRVRGVEFGLHFNLTHPESGGLYPTLPRFLWAWYWGRWTGNREIVGRVRDALKIQIGLMRQKGIQPLRLEGHHHVHAVPGLLDEISDILKAAGIRRVRVPYHPSLWLGRRVPIAWLGGTLRGAAQKLNFAFLPFYYPTARDFSSFNRLVHCLNRTARSEVIIHPASRNDIPKASPSDSYREGRVAEFSLLRLLSLELQSGKTARGGTTHAGS
ncbi:MAG TPA: ChbG/HpnK family deacetylase [bacterium]|nr:ChbG/HpnK family deacetylase [bacterium]